MMVRTGAVVSGALDGNEHLNEDFLAGWDEPDRRRAAGGRAARLRVAQE